MKHYKTSMTFTVIVKKIPTRRLSRKELKLIGEAIYKPLFRHCDELDEEIYNAFDELLKINF